jgi:regulator of protease activity HflC (stomatin/prohibitin superfamily)
MNALIALGITFVACLIAEPLLLGLGQILGVFTIVRERRCHVYVLFGTVTGKIDEPGLHFLWPLMGWKALLVNWLGNCYRLDMRLDQVYLRSQPVNSEEGAPMGIGIWYEMFISDPVAFLFKNRDPRGSLAANVSNSTVRCLSNLPLASMMVNRHGMSHTVRDEVSVKSHEWGYRLGSVYIRKVHFRDLEMIHQIESKVVNRLRQVTSAIKQDGQAQIPYARKNWSSVVLWNCDHPGTRYLTPDVVNTQKGLWLHQFTWLDDSAIGELDPEWNHLVGEAPRRPGAKLVHFTQGTPNMPGYEDCEFAREWRDELSKWAWHDELRLAS